MTRASLTALPPEVLFLIIKYLSVSSLRLLHQCNRQFHKLFSSQLWKVARTSRNAPDCGTLLIWAAQNENIPVLRRLLEGPEWPADNEFGTTAIHEAILSQNEESVCLLLDAGADLTTPDSRGLPPLVVAAKCPSTAILHIVLEKSHKNLSRNELQQQWRGALKASVKAKCEPVLRLILDYADLFCDGDLSKDLTSMLHTKAAEGGDCGIIKTLCDYGADPHGEPGYLLDTLVEGNHADAIRLCAQYGISQEYRQERVNLLQVAAMNGYIRSVSALLDAGFDLEHEGRARRTPLLDAVQGGHIETTRYLLDAGANIRVQDREGHNALDLAVRCDEPHEMLELLIGRGAEINRQPGNGGTPVLHWAACMGLISYINKFCAAGVPVNLRDAYGQTALHHAARTGKTETIRALLQGGADPSAMDDEHKTPVHEAAWRRDPTGIRLLLHANAACNTPDVRGYVPLHVAAQHGSIETCRLILERLDDSEYLGSTKGGQMALHLATKGGHLEVVQLLLDAGISQKDALLCHPALHEAAAGRHLDILKLLTLDNTADPYYIDAYGRTAFDWASTDPAALAIMKSRYGKYTPTESKMRRARLIETVVELGTSFIKQLEVARWQLNPRVLIRALLYLDEKSQQPSSTDEKP